MKFISKLLLATGIALLCCRPSSAVGRELPPVLPESVASDFGDLMVRYGGRVEPVSTMAEEICLRVYGKSSLFGYTPTQVVSGYLFYYDYWRDIPFESKLDDADCMEIMAEVSSGRAFRIFPLNFSDSLRTINPGLPERLWLGCDDTLPVGLDYDEWVYVRRTLDLLSDLLKDGDYAGAEAVIAKIAKWQTQNASDDIPSGSSLKAERLYNSIARPLIPFILSLLLGILLFAFSSVLTSRGEPFPKWLKLSAFVLMALLFVYLSAVIGLRWYLAGHGPFDGGYAVMMLIAFLSALVSICLAPRNPMVYPLGFLLSGFAMLEAWLSGADALIKPLNTALSSPFLSVHVTCMMISYTLLGLLALGSVMALLVRGTGAKSRLAAFLTKILIPAECLLVLGTLLGSIWAKQAWGSFWSWDPKETWALITAIVYALVILFRCLDIKGRIKTTKGTEIFNTLCVIAFVFVLITYFGVNLLFGGMHSYL